MLVGGLGWALLGWVACYDSRIKGKSEDFLAKRDLSALGPLGAEANSRMQVAWELLN